MNSSIVPDLPARKKIAALLDAADAKRALDRGVDGIVASNHGGRQLEDAPSSLERLPEIADAANGRMHVFMDGGVRRGSDIAKALALGARAVLLGRAPRKRWPARRAMRACPSCCPPLPRRCSKTCARRATAKCGCSSTCSAIAASPKT